MKIVQDPDIYSTWGVHGPFIQNWVFKCCYLVIIRVLTPAGSTPGLQPRGAEDPHPHVCLNELIVVLLPVFIWWLLSAGADRPVSHKLHQHLKSNRSEHRRSNLRLSVSCRCRQLQSIFSLHTKLHAHMYFYYWSTFIAKTVLLTFETFTRVLFIRVTFAFPK